MYNLYCMFKIMININIKIKMFIKIKHTLHYRGPGYNLYSLTFVSHFYTIIIRLTTNVLVIIYLFTLTTLSNIIVLLMIII